MSKRDYYTVLGLERNATSDEIKHAYRKMASKHHPDKVTDIEEKKIAEANFKEVGEAYEILSNPDKRATFDYQGHDNPSQNPFGHQPRDDNMRDIFEELFKRNNSFSKAFDDDIFRDNKSSRSRQDVFVITISLQDAFRGRTVKTDIHTTIRIPKGIRSGSKIAVDGKLFRIDVQPDHKFKRSGDDLLIDVEITAIEAMLGVEAVFEHLDGIKLQFTIPAGIQNGQIVKLGQKGITNPETDQSGDMMVRIAITIPKTLSQEERVALKTISHRDTINL